MANLDALRARIRRLRQLVMGLVVVCFAVGVPATFLWGKGGHEMFGEAERTNFTVILLGLGAGACAVLASLLALRIVNLSDRLPRGR